MPFYKLSEMPEERAENAPMVAKSVGGELMKVGMVTYRESEGPPPHFHPNEEQFILVMSGKLKMILGDEEQIIEPGDLIHVPRDTNHGVSAVGGEAVFFTCKSPAGNGDLNQDYNKAENADKLMDRLHKIE